MTPSPGTRRAARRAARTWLLPVVIVTVLAATLVAGVTAAPNLPSCKVADTLTKHRSLDDWHRAMLDTRFRLSSKHVPTDLRSTAAAGLNGGARVRKIVIADLKAMTRAARASGARFAVQSAYRSYATQKYTFARWVRIQGYERALKESARAGHSEHQLGTTIDFRSVGGAAPWDYADWGTTKAGKWLKKHAWKYGFVMSYPKGESSVTCYAYEPWHYRYVGRAAAKKIHDRGLTTREYLWREQNAPAPSASPTPSPDPTPSDDPSPSPDPTPDPTPSDDPGPTPES